MLFSHVSEGFKIDVVTGFDFEKSNPLRFYYVFSYKITLTNHSLKNAQLISRKWFIEDASGKVDIVEGPGVVGKRPYFKPGERFSYTSFCPLSTLQGKMYGLFYMKDDQGEFFAIETPLFEFSIPAEYTAP